jgi:hypothetical protein
MDEQSELVKEVFAGFGTAYYESEVLHRSLCHVYALATFETPESVTRPRLDEKLTFAYSLTLGQVIKESKHIFPTDIQEQLDLPIFLMVWTRQYQISFIRFARSLALLMKWCKKSTEGYFKARKTNP